MFKRMKKFVQRHAAKLQVGITVIGTGITVATIFGLAAMGETLLAVALTGWAVFCLSVGIFVSAQAQGIAPVAAAA